jgi:hypothetical protein
LFFYLLHILSWKVVLLTYAPSWLVIRFALKTLLLLRCKYSRVSPKFYFTIFICVHLCTPRRTQSAVLVPPVCLLWCLISHFAIIFCIMQVNLWYYYITSALYANICFNVTFYLYFYEFCNNSLSRLSWCYPIVFFTKYA